MLLQDPVAGMEDGESCSMTGERPQRRTPAATLAPVPMSPGDAEALWVVDESNTMLAWDERTGQVTARVDLGRPGDVRWHLQAGGGLVWAFGSDGSTAVVDPATAGLLTPPMIEPRPHRGVVGMPFYAHGAMWIWGADRVWRATGSGETSAAPIARDNPPVAGVPVQAAATDRWVFFGHGRQLLRIDPRTGSVTDESERLHAALRAARIPPPGVLDSMAAGPDDLVIAMGYNEPDIVILDPGTIEPKRTTRVPDGSFAVTVYQSGPHIWALSENTAMGIGTDAAGDPPLVRLNWIESNSAVMARESLWIVHRDAQALVRLHLPTGRILARMTIPDAFWDRPNFRIVAGRRTLWLICRIDPIGDGIYQVNPTANQVLRLAHPGDLDNAHAVVAAAPRNE